MGSDAKRTSQVFAKKPGKWTGVTLVCPALGQLDPPLKAGMVTRPHCPEQSHQGHIGAPVVSILVVFS